MAVRMTFIGRPATGAALMNAIKNELVAAGWTLLAEGTYENGDAYKFLKTAAYIMPDNTDAGSAVLKLLNPSGTNHVDIQMGQDYDSDNIALVPPTTSVRRLSYSYQSTLYYRQWSCEYWFFLLHVNSGNVLQGYGANIQHVSAAGTLVPPPGIPTKPTYKAVFVLSAYNTEGTVEMDGTARFVFGSASSYSNAFVIHPSTGGENRAQVYSHVAIYDKYAGHPDNPLLLFPTSYLETGTSPGILGRLPYTLASGVVTADTSQTINTETWQALFNGYNNAGTLWLRIS